MLVFYVGLSGVWTFIGSIASAAAIDPASSGRILAIATLLGIAGSACAALIGQRWPRGTMLLLGYALMTGAVLLLLDEPGLARFATAALVFKYTWTFALPFILACLADLDRDGRLMNTTNLLIGGGSPGPGHRRPAAGEQRRHARRPASQRHLPAAVLRRPQRQPPARHRANPFPRRQRSPTMSRRTAFFSDELCFWHSAGMHALTLPVGGWVQPPAATASPNPRDQAPAEEPAGCFRPLPPVAAARRGAGHARDLLRVHPAHYLERFKALSDAGGGELGSEAPIGPGSYEIARLSAGLAIAAVDCVLRGEADNAYSLSRPPGHHCLADQAMGFCFLANIPIAIEAARVKHGLRRVAVIDWDVHHGNGTQSIYEEDGEVLTISLHQENCYPPGYSGAEDRGRGEGLGSNINIPCRPAAGMTPTCRPCVASCSRRCSASARS